MQQRYLTFALFEGDGMLGGSLDGVDREALYKAVRAGLIERGRSRPRKSQFRFTETFPHKRSRPLLPAIYQAIYRTRAQW